MNFKLKLRISIVLTVSIAMIVPSVAVAQPINPLTIYSLGNNYDILISNGNIDVNYYDNHFINNWQYYVSGNNSLVLQHFSSRKVEFVNNGLFNVLSVILNNSKLRVYESYYVQNGVLGTSLFMENLQKQNLTPIAILKITQLGSSPLSLIKQNGRCINLNNSNYLINNIATSSILGARLGGFGIFWNEAAGLMGPASMTKTNTQKLVALSMGDNLLTSNSSITLNLDYNYQGPTKTNSPILSPATAISTTSEGGSTHTASLSKIMNGNKVVGYISASQNGPVGAVSNCIPESDSYTSSVSGDSSYDTYQIKETVSLTGTSTGVSQSTLFTLRQDYYENYTNNYPTVMQYVVTAIVDALHLAGIPVPNPYGLIPKSFSEPTSGTNAYTITHAGSYIPYNAFDCGHLGTNCQPTYGSIVYNYGFFDFYQQTVNEFGFRIHILNYNPIGGSSSNPAYNNYEFSVQYSIFETSDPHSLYGGTNSVAFSLPEST